MTESTSPRAGWGWRLTVLAILGAGAAGFILLQVLKPRPAVKPPVKQPPLVRIAPVDFRTGALTVVGHGLVKPRAEVALAAEVAGRVTFVSPALVSGGAFAKGDVLVRLDQDPFKAALAQAEADRRSAAASLELAEQLLKRTRELIAQRFLSQQTLDERIANRDQAAAAVARAEAVELARRIDLERSVIVAPFKGRVLSERVDPGETVQPGKELARIFADDALEIAASLTDREIALVPELWQGGRAATGNARAIVEHGGSRYQWPARVDRVEAAVDSATRTFQVVVRVDRPNARGEPVDGSGPPGPPLLVGMYAAVEIAGRDQGRYAVVPRRALRDGNVLWLIGPEDTVQIRRVKPLLETRRTIAVSAEGLEPGARLIVSEIKVVTEGMPVRTIDAPQPASPAPGQDAR